MPVRLQTRDKRLLGVHRCAQLSPFGHFGLRTLAWNTVSVAMRMQCGRECRDAAEERHKGEQHFTTQGGVEKVVLRPGVRLRGVLYLSLRLANATVKEPRTTSVHVHRFHGCSRLVGNDLQDSCKDSTGAFCKRSPKAPATSRCPQAWPVQTF